MADDDLTHLDQMPPDRHKGFAELAVLLDIPFERNWAYLGDLLPQLLKESLTTQIEKLQFLLCVLELTH